MVKTTLVFTNLIRLFLTKLIGRKNYINFEWNIYIFR